MDEENEKAEETKEVEDGINRRRGKRWKSFRRCRRQKDGCLG